MPAVMVMPAIRVLMAMMLAARRSLPPIARTITKLAAAVGEAKNRNSTPSSVPRKPSSTATVVASSGTLIIFIRLALRASLRPSRSERIDRVPPMQINASGSVMRAK